MMYKITVTEEQLRVLEKCTEIYMRLMMGQVRELADELAFYDIHKFIEAENYSKIHSRACDTRDSIYEVLSSVMRIVFRSPYGVPHEKTGDGMIAECIWEAVKVARGTSRFGEAYQVGEEPVPDIEILERKDENWDKVVKNGKYNVPDKDKGKVFTVISDPWEVCGTVVVKLHGKSGGYAVDGLDVVKEVQGG